jgi:hypothetical protein
MFPTCCLASADESDHPIALGEGYQEQPPSARVADDDLSPLLFRPTASDGHVKRSVRRVQMSYVAPHLKKEVTRFASITPFVAQK